MSGFLCFTQGVTSRKNYANIECELLAIVFHQFIYGGTTLVKTDHCPLINLFKKPLTMSSKDSKALALTAEVRPSSTIYTREMATWSRCLVKSS